MGCHDVRGCEIEESLVTRNYISWRKICIQYLDGLVRVCDAYCMVAGWFVDLGLRRRKKRLESGLVDSPQIDCVGYSERKLEQELNDCHKLWSRWLPNGPFWSVTGTAMPEVLTRTVCFSWKCGLGIGHFRALRVSDKKLDHPYPPPNDVTQHACQWLKTKCLVLDNYSKALMFLFMIVAIMILTGVKIT
ncbi:hypothetical protein BO83DRAFT_193593 [Aspergillus eucalypticola CBS 122712]|uniref:Uncharacterized protein n=1 Tax=Aspergillus eucalypticola (strain CBS 122712 / IBT 29274) TaxID=1448314 RepID=A0A317UQ69_ASPEC|nr:uncharacterized protein BO83DRAFT_193593 [Aspergillus eucalypticola CBS 122712]PWY62170.1 hypothetical protein BO83DRAFT_193593 [Aspergillus eucalypticola CBS 122712]